MAKRKVDPIWDVICELFGLEAKTKKEMARIGRVVQDLRAKKATVSQIRRVYQRCNQEWRSARTFGPEAIPKWFDQFKVAPKQERPLPKRQTEADEAEDLRRDLFLLRREPLPHELTLLKKYPKEKKQ